MVLARKPPWKQFFSKCFCTWYIGPSEEREKQMFRAFYWMRNWLDVLICKDASNIAICSWDWSLKFTKLPATFTVLHHNLVPSDHSHVETMQWGLLYGWDGKNSFLLLAPFGLQPIFHWLSSSSIHAESLSKENIMSFPEILLIWNLNDLLSILCRYWNDLSFKY